MSTPATTGQWLFPAEVRPDTSVRLMLFPHAGSGGTIYRNWHEYLPHDVAHQIVNLPGREKRLAEEAFTEIEPLVEATAEAIADDLDDRPYAFFGHCLGAQLAYRVSLVLQRDGLPAPLLLGVSGWAPEGFSQVTYEQSQMPEPELVGWMRTLGSFPEEVYGNQDLLTMIVPALRADLAVVSTYRDDKARTESPVVAYSGRSDPLMDPGAMASWDSRTPRYLGNSEFTGDHFYIDDREHALAVTGDLVRHLRRELARAAA
ncbi:MULTISPECIES: thioesterase domain-containing protein [Kitasatospora]|uniref:Putative thioesterase n=1 Tax=Kitasatospora setae (strain ATCC 33774 / DSM 43861 / JCM 3304 / KCC A-0304 / NBRC 14216 / KM-6054) TaxID=452652 RepID=E4NBF5_KITSK|nr:MULTISPECIES: thioesterase domain-containing protein [Kitasatospora]BAJ28536.1 putative thioesterase [Kitasatospora setae KM-6054]